MKNKKTSTKKPESEAINFEMTLFNSLKKNGYLFPKTSEEVETFEGLYGNTEIETPAFDFSMDKNANQSSELSNLNFKMAAFNPKKNTGLKFPSSGQKNDKSDNSDK